MDKHIIESITTINNFTITTYIPDQTQEELDKAKKNALLALYNIFSNENYAIDTTVK